MILFLLLILPSGEPTRVDIIELNEVYYVHLGDEFAAPELQVDLRQFIFWSLEGDKYEVRDFHVDNPGRFYVIKNGLSDRRSDCACESPDSLSLYELRLYKHGKKYHITAPAYIRTFTDYDPEIKERETLPKHKRRHIFK